MAIQSECEGFATRFATKAFWAVSGVLPGWLSVSSEPASLLGSAPMELRGLEPLTSAMEGEIGDSGVRLISGLQSGKSAHPCAARRV